MAILLVKLGAIGDVIQTAAAVLYYKQRNPDVRVDWAVGRSIALLVQAFNVADMLFAVDDRCLYMGPLISRMRAFLREIRRLGKLRATYELVVIPYFDFRYRVLTMFVRRKKTRTFRRDDRRNTVWLSSNRVIECYRLLANGEGQPPPVAELMYELGEKINTYCAKNKITSLCGGHYVVLCPGGARNLVRDDGKRRWPTKNYRLLAERLIREGINVVIAGGPTDTWVLPQFRNVPVINFIGKTDLFQMWMLLGRAAAVVTHDSGPLHLAVTTRASIVALFGPTPETAIIPAGRKKTIGISADDSTCRASLTGSRESSVHPNRLRMEAISVDQVHDAVSRILESEVAEPNR